MKLWHRAAGALKDRNSIVVARLTRKSALRHPDIEAAVIRATSHDASHVDYNNSQRVFTWVRRSPIYSKPLLWAISVRMEKTRSWVVAIKGLILMHGVFCCRVPAVLKIGRLPFDLSKFKDGHSNPRKTWGKNAFIRSYYAFLDQKSTFLFLDFHERNGRQRRVDDQEQAMMRELGRLQKLQSLLDMLMQIKPQDVADIGILILEAMDCVLIEIFDTYGTLCRGIAKILGTIRSAGKVEAALAIKILRKANLQADELSLYLDYCGSIRVINASECPQIEQIPEEDIQQVELITNCFSKKYDSDQAIVVQENPSFGNSNDSGKEILEWDARKFNNPNDSEKSIVAWQTQSLNDPNESTNSLRTIITNNWEVFDDYSAKDVNGGGSFSSRTVKDLVRTNPFVVYSSPPRHALFVKKDLPDLITF